MQRDFTAVAFLRQISIITKLLFFSGSVEKHRRTDRTTVACDILYILFLFASFWLRRPPLVVDERLWFLSCFSHEWLNEAAAAVVAFFNCVYFFDSNDHTQTHSFRLLLSSCLRFDSLSTTISKIHPHNSPIYGSKQLWTIIRISLSLKRLSARRSWCRNGTKNWEKIALFLYGSVGSVGRNRDDGNTGLSTIHASSRRGGTCPHTNTPARTHTQTQTDVPSKGEPCPCCRGGHPDDDTNTTVDSAFLL